MIRNLLVICILIVIVGCNNNQVIRKEYKTEHQLAVEFAGTTDVYKELNIDHRYIVRTTNDDIYMITAYDNAFLTKTLIFSGHK